jgi:hypothetical protein
MTRTRGALLVAAVAGLLTLPPLGQRVLAPSNEVRCVLYAQETCSNTPRSTPLGPHDARCVVRSLPAP